LTGVFLFILGTASTSAFRGKVPVWAAAPIGRTDRSVTSAATRNAFVSCTIIPVETSRIHIGTEHAGKRIDVAAAELTGLTRSRIRHLIDGGLLLVNGKEVKQNYRARPEDVISLSIPTEEPTLVPEDLPVEILYQDESVIVVNKPPGMVVYPGAGHNSGTLMNAVARCSPALATVGAPLRPGVVHRLDRDTSGVMVIALTDGAYYNLVEQFRERTISRKYMVLVYGNLREDCGEISLKIGRSESDRKKMSTRTRRGKEAVTHWKVLERYRYATLIEAKLGTGRTHQIRVHFASLGHPVLGDRTYGKKTVIEAGKTKIAFERQMLHAMTLGFVHPMTGQYMEFEKEMPNDLKEKVLRLREVVRLT
jgi:23S rRNA pseudouridine1911/1915/1917 synthase